MNLADTARLLGSETARVTGDALPRQSFKGGWLMDDDAESAAFAACPAVPAYPLTTLSPYLSREEVAND